MLDIVTQTEVLAHYPPTREHRDWPEGAVYRFDRFGHELLRIVKGIDAVRVDAVLDGPIEVALMVDGPLVVLFSRIGGLPWAGAAFQWHRVPRSERVLPPTLEETQVGEQVNLRLIEAQGGRLHATRSLTYPIEFNMILHEAIRDQASYHYDPIDERRALESLILRCPTPDLMVRCAGLKATITT